MPDTFESTYERLCAADGAFEHPVLQYVYDSWFNRRIDAWCCSRDIAHAAIAHHVLMTLGEKVHTPNGWQVYILGDVVGLLDATDVPLHLEFPHTPLGILQLALAVVGGGE